MTAAPWLLTISKNAILKLAGVDDRACRHPALTIVSVFAATPTGLVVDQQVALLH